MSEPVEAALHAAGIGPKLKAALEFGPILGFVAVYLLVREQTYTLAGRDWDGFVLLVGGFVPVVLAASLTMWRLTGRVSPGAGADPDHHVAVRRADRGLQRRAVLQDAHNCGVPDALGDSLGRTGTRAELA